MKEFNIQDTLRVSDSKIKGFVVMQREDGSTVFAKPNMIVEDGRNYIMELVYEQVAGGSVTDAFGSIKFGTSTGTTTPDMDDLQAVDSNITAIPINITTDVWSEVITTYNYGTDNPPATAVLGELYVKDTGTGYTLYTATATNTWNGGVVLANGVTLPGTVGTYFFKTNNTKLYYGSKVLEKIPSTVGLGLKITIDVIGNASASDAVTELGLFLDDGTLFSRIVFDPIPLTDGFSYKLTYYIYF